MLAPSRGCSSVGVVTPVLIKCDGLIVLAISHHVILICIILVSIFTNVTWKAVIWLLFPMIMGRELGLLDGPYSRHSEHRAHGPVPVPSILLCREEVTPPLGVSVPQLTNTQFTKCGGILVKADIGHGKDRQEQPPPIMVFSLCFRIFQNSWPPPPLKWMKVLIQGRPHLQPGNTHQGCSPWS